MVKTTEVDHATGDRQEARRLYFRAVAVFDRASVDPIPGADPTSLEAPCEPLTGDSHRHLLERLAAFAVELGYTITYQQIPGPAAGGVTPRPRPSSSTPARQPTPRCGSSPTSLPTPSASATTNTPAPRRR